MTDEQRGRLAQQLRAMPERYRAPLALCYMEGQNPEQAAVLLALKPATLRKRLERGRNRLRARLPARGDGKPFTSVFHVVKSLIRQASCRGKKRHGRVRAHMHTRTDAELLNDYVSTGNEAAFGEIVTRHGAFVHRTCLRLLKDAHEAQDACQAVFLVLARKAPRLRGGDLSAWLYRVGQLVAAETARKRMRRAQREERYAADEPGSGEAPVLEETDRQAVLDAVDAELMALSGANREAVLLRYLRGHSQEEAARLAGCSVSALSVRASRGIEAIRRRLSRRGIALSVPVLAAALESEAQAAIPETVLASTMAAVKAYAAGTAATAAVSANVTALTKGVCNMLFWSSVKTTAMVTAVSVVVAGAGVVVAQRAADKADGKVNTITSPPVEAVTTNNGIVMTTRLPKSVWLEKEPLKFTVCLENITEKPIDMGKTRLYPIILTDAILRHSYTPRNEGGFYASEPSAKTLQPKENMTIEIDLSRHGGVGLWGGVNTNLFDMSARPGQSPKDGRRHPMPEFLPAGNYDLRVVFGCPDRQRTDIKPGTWTPSWRYSSDGLPDVTPARIRVESAGKPAN